MWNNEVTLENEDGTRISCTNLGLLNRLVSQINETFKEKPEEEKDGVLIPFEFIIGSLFPNAYENIKTSMTQQYIIGYNAANEEGVDNNGN